jgi:hypothetical protein
MRSRLIALVGVSLLGAGALPSPAQAAPTVTVDTMDDGYDGTCADDCSIRDAIASVDDGGTVRIPPGSYPLSVSGAGGIEAGDLDLDRPVRIVGTGPLGAFLDGSALGDRIFDVAASVELHRMTLLGGSQVGTGGLVRVASGRARIADATLVGGLAQNGGAVAVGAGAAVRLVRSWVSSSMASGRGGAIFALGVATVVRSALSETEAAAGGGVWVADTASVLLSNSTISGASALRGGGGLHVRGAADLRSATIARNAATTGGGVFATPAADVVSSASVFEGNQATDRAPTCSRPLTTGGRNVADGAGCGLDGPGDRTRVDPLLGPLRSNGGPTPTHALRIGSPAVGNGGASCPAVDQRGAPRRDCDSGAYELVFCLGRPVTIVGTPRHDDLSGGLGRDVFLGQGGNDDFQGSIAADRACGGRGNDHLIGGPDDDRLTGGAGRDVLEGEGGDDRLDGGGDRDRCLGDGGADEARRCEVVTSAT